MRFIDNVQFSSIVVRHNALASSNVFIAMSTGAQPSTLAIPTITEQDLVAFHTKHFKDAHGPSHFFVDSSADTSIKVGDASGDDLGYYPDGAKRTLTDDDIAFFRNSEIQRALKLRRRQREREEDDLELEQTDSIELVETQSQDVENVEHRKPHMDYTSVASHNGVRQTAQEPHVESQASNAPSKAAKKKNNKKKKKNQNRSDLDRPGRAAPKRKWQEYLVDDAEAGGNLTHRRLARELDEQATTSADLIYDDEDD